MSLTPVEPLIQRMVHHVYFPWAVPIFIHKFFMFSEAIQVSGILTVNQLTVSARGCLYTSENDSV